MNIREELRLQLQALREGLPALLLLLLVIGAALLLTDESILREAMTSFTQVP